MTGKRYKLIYNPHTILWDNFEDKEVFAWAEDDNPQEIVDKMNELYEENKELKRENLNVMSDLDYYRTKSGSCEEELFQKDKEIAKLKLQNGELLYQIGREGKNNKTCRECECFISEIKYCYMWDMEVEADDVVVACDQRKVKNTNEMI